MTQQDAQATIDYLSKLSLLRLEEREHDSLMIDIENILTYIHALDAINVDGALETFHGTTEEMVVREDVVLPSEHAQDLVARAPEQADGQLKVKGVFRDGA